MPACSKATAASFTVRLQQVWRRITLNNWMRMRHSLQTTFGVLKIGRMLQSFRCAAGRNALRVYAMREAMSHFERAHTALENTPNASPQSRIDAILGWAQAAVRYRPYPEQLTQLSVAEELARAINDKPRLAQILYRGRQRPNGKRSQFARRA